MCLPGQWSVTTYPDHARSMRWPGRLLPVIAGLASFAAYLITLLPGIAFGDSGEMQTVPYVLGVAHPTGYPSYILMAWAAQFVTVGSLAFRANLLSAIFVALSVAVTCAILTRLGVRATLALATSLALGAVGTVWSSATVAEVNALHLLAVSLLIHRALIWETRKAPIDLVLGGLLLGLALGNHLLILFAAPFIVLFVAWTGRRQIMAMPRVVLATVGAVLLGLTVYVYIPIAASHAPPLAYNHPVTAESWWWLVSGTQFRGQFDFFTSAGPGELVASLPALWTLLVTQATVVMPLLGLVGLALLVWRRPAFGVMAVAILSTGLYVWANYLRLDHYLLVPWLILAIGAGFALERLACGLACLPGLRRPRVAQLLVPGIALVMAAGLWGVNWHAADRSLDRGAEAYIAAMFAALPVDAAVLTEWDVSTPLWHAQLILGQRPDILVVDDTNVVFEGWGTRERRIKALICERPVFILRLRDSALEATRAAFTVEPFLDVRVAFGGPTATVTRTVMRVTPREAGGCEPLARPR